MSLICVKHNRYFDTAIEFSGGCEGGHGEDSYCYCDSPDVKVILYCGGDGSWRSTHSVKIVEGLTDQYAIARFIESHLEGTICERTGKITPPSPPSNPIPTSPERTL